MMIVPTTKKSVYVTVRDARTRRSKSITLKGTTVATVLRMILAAAERHPTAKGKCDTDS